MFEKVIQKPNLRDENKLRAQSHFIRNNYKKWILVMVIFSLAYWVFGRSHFQRTLADIEEIVERIVKDNSETLPEISDMAQDEPAVVDFVRKQYILKAGTVSNDKNTRETPPPAQQGLVDYLISKNFIDSKVPGYFIEIGTHNSTGFTSTLTLDRTFGWSGLVVEPVSNPFQIMVQARQQSKRQENEVVVSQATIAAYPYITLSKFYYNPKTDVWGGLNFRFYKETSAFVNVLCIPLYTLLLAANIPPRVDLLILDIEGSELDVLKTLPFEKLKVSLIVAETCNGESGPTAVQDFLLEKNYNAVEKLKVPFTKELTARVSGIIKREDVFSEYTIFQLLT